MKREQIEALIKKAYKMGFQDGRNHKDNTEVNEDNDALIAQFLETNEPSTKFSDFTTIEGDGQTSCTRVGS